MNVIVFGCGPAGLAAAAGAVAGGASDLQIISRKRKSELFGAQYLHAPIPGYTDEARRALVRYTTEGTTKDYRDKVYGRDWDGNVSPEDLAANHEAWDIRDTYDHLWDAFHQTIDDLDDVTSAIFDSIVSTAPSGTLVINSIPRPALCSQGHSFGAQAIWAAGDAPERGINLQYSCPPNTVLCNGTEDVSWYRLSNVFGYKTVEWSQHRVKGRPPVSTAAEVAKPTRHNCTCHSDVVHVGRYGKWEKGVLSHTSYDDARLAVIATLNGAPVALPGLGAL